MGTVTCLRSCVGGVEKGMPWGREVPTLCIQFNNTQGSPG